MYRNKLFDKLRNGETVYGISINFPEPGMIECMNPDWDYLWLDEQHGQFSYDTLRLCCMAARSAGLDVIIRVPGHDFSVTGPAADLCTSGVMVPMVNTGEEAEDIVQKLSFPPRGYRSYWSSRAMAIAGKDCHLTQDLMKIVQIETVEAVKNVEEIAAVDGVDVLMFGPSDLSMSYGLPLGTNRHQDERMMHAAESMIAAAKKYGKYSMFIAGSAEDARELKAMGANILVCGSDDGFISQGAAQMIEALGIGGRHGRI